MSGYNEEAYREARTSVIGLACPFERALLSGCIACVKANRLLLAEREAISCTEQTASDQCQTLHGLLHHNARFALHVDSQHAWPFGKEIRAQCGGVRGLADALGVPGTESTDVAATIDAAVAHFGTIDQFPYSEIMRAVVHYEPRKRKS